MSWSCGIKGSKIYVNNDGKTIGYYDLMEKPYCSICALPKTVDEDCHRIHELDFFDKVYALGIYYQKYRQMSDLLSEHILKLKRDSSYAIPISIGMSIVMREVFPELQEFDGIVPIPLHPQELYNRGFNQSMELARELSARVGVPAIDALEKTRPQSLQNFGFLARMNAVDGLYKIKDNINVTGKTLIVVDDVFAAGATCCESAKMLKQANAKSVVAFVAGRTIYSGTK